MTRAQHKEAYASLNPNRQVPLLVDGDLKLTEGSAILKYIAEKYQLPSYPPDLKKRAKINDVDPETRDIIQNVYVRKVDRVQGELQNVEFETFEAVKDPIKATGVRLICE